MLKRWYYWFKLWLSGFRKPNYRYVYTAVMPKDVNIRIKYIDKDESVS